MSLRRERHRYNDTRHLRGDMWFEVPDGRRSGEVYYNRSAYFSGQWTSSEGNPYQKLGKDSRVDIGGDFETIKIEKSLGDWTHVSLREPPSFFGSFRYEGIPIASSQLLPFEKSSVDTQTTAAARSYYLARMALVPSSASALDAFGATAISRVKPTNPTVDLAISLGEFVSERKFFSLPGTSGSLPGEYLNYMFGIAPTLADIQDLRKAILTKEKILAQYARDSGRLVRRRYETDETVETEKTVSSPTVAVTPSGQPLSSWICRTAPVVRITKKTTKYWFSGAFTYYLPREGLMRTVAELDRLYGVVPGTALAWELTPYSWLLDYKLSVGSALSNIDAFAQDGLVMPYGYVMRSQIIEDEYTWAGELRHGGVFSPHTLSGKVVSTIKQRRAANPFGFGIKEGDLSARQLSIIAALGLTKLER